MTSGVKRTTPNLGLFIPVFDTPMWGRYMEQNFDIIDAGVFSQTQGDVRYVNVTGDTMTGSLQVAPAAANPSLILNFQTGFISNVTVRKNGVERWQQAFDDTTYYVKRYNDAGTLIANPLTIDRATGQVFVEAAPSQALGVATKGYVDTADTTLTNSIASLTTTVNGKEPTITAGTTAQYWRGDKSWQTLNKAAVGLDQVDNTSDANKPVSSATTTALNLKEDKSAKGAVNGYAPLDASSKVPAINLPAYVDDVLEYANFAALPGSGTTGIIYITLDNNKTYRWSGSAYVEISPSPGSSDAVPEGTTNKYYTDARAALKADLASPVFTGDPRAPTPATGDNDTSIATTAYVKAQDYLTTTTALGSFVDIAGDAMTGPLALPNGSASTPSIHFGTANTGVYGDAGAVTFTVGGTLAGQVNATSTVGTTFSASAVGSAAAPAYRFGSSTNSGMFFSSGVIIAHVGSNCVTFTSTGSTFTTPVITLASTTGAAGLRLPHGVAPTTPVNGDIWTTTAGMYAQVNGATVGPIGSGLSYPLLAPNGSVTAPSYSFSGGTGTGMYTANATSMVNLAAGGVAVAQFGSSLATFPGEIETTHSGSAAATSINFGTNGTGIYGGSTALFFSSGSTLRFTISSTITSTVPVSLPNTGTYSLTSLNFGATNTGLYGDSSSISFACAATVAPTSVMTATTYTTECYSRGPRASATTPTYSFTLNTNSGMYSDASGNVNLATGGTQRLGISATAATYTVPVITVASATGASGLNLPHGTAPTTPVNGDLWTTTTGVYAQVNGATVGPLGAGGGGGLPTTGGTMTGVITIPSGSASLPSIAINSTNTGIYGSANDVILGTAGTERFRVTNGFVQYLGAMRATTSGSTTAPAYGFNTETNAGMYRAGAGDIRMCGAGADMVKWVNGTQTNFGPIILPAGTVSATSLNFGTAGTGLYGDSTSVRTSISGAETLTCSATAVSTFKKLVTLSSASANAGIILPHGSAPSSPNNGDMWTTSAGGLFVQINGATVGPLMSSAAYTAADVLAKMLTVDGAGSGLDADTLDGISSAGFVASSQLAVKITVASSAPGSPSVNDVWIDTT